jgi:hypothetical protein
LTPGQEKRFFFEKKKQKTFARSAPLIGLAADQTPPL